MQMIEKLTWLDVRKQVKSINAELYSLIEQISPDTQFPLYKVRYFYGQQIVENGLLFLPDAQGCYHRLDSGKLDARLVSAFDGCHLPLLLQLQRVSETCVDTGSRIIPLSVAKPGEFIGLFDTMTSSLGCSLSPAWSTYSGSRSAFMLPRISDCVFHKRLGKHVGVNTPPPRSYYEQWNVFKSIHQHSSDPQQWYTDVLVFSAPWLSEKHDSLAWLQFQRYLLQMSWRSAHMLHRKHHLSLLWDSFLLKLKDLKFSLYSFDTLRHLLLLVGGSIPGFRPLLGCDDYLPATIIEAAYVDVYRLVDYYPQLMVPDQCHTGDEKRFLYYSLSYPTLIEGSAAVRSLVAELLAVKDLFQRFRELLMRGELSCEPNSFRLGIVDFFHPSLTANQAQLGDDPHLNIHHHPSYPGRRFADKSYFLRGCMRVSD